MGAWLCVFYCENDLSSSSMLSHWAANALSVLMPDERLLKNMPAEKNNIFPCPSISSEHTVEMQVGVIVKLE